MLLCTLTFWFIDKNLRQKINCYVSSERSCIFSCMICSFPGLVTPIGDQWVCAGESVSFLLLSNDTCTGTQVLVRNKGLSVMVRECGEHPSELHDRAEPEGDIGVKLTNTTPTDSGIYEITIVVDGIRKDYSTNLTVYSRGSINFNALDILHCNIINIYHLLIWVNW